MFPNDINIDCFNCRVISRLDSFHYIIEYDKKFNPIDENGGGVVDIVSFALRIALWNIKKGKKLNALILDEPFRFISEDLRYKAGEILKQLSEKLKLQFIIVTHDPNIIEIADRSFLVKKARKTSKIERI